LAASDEGWCRKVISDETCRHAPGNFIRLLLAAEKRTIDGRG
jgi:hypothetical protein